MGDRPRLELFAGLAALYKSRDHADLTLISSDGATTHAVHRAIVCPRSAPLDAQVKAATWKVRGRETRTGGPRARAASLDGRELI
jgi:hypothetical protein